MLNRTSELGGGIGSLVLAGVLVAGAIALDAFRGWVIVGVLALLGMGIWELSRAFGGKAEQQGQVDDLSRRISGLEGDPARPSDRE